MKHIFWGCFIVALLSFNVSAAPVSAQRIQCFEGCICCMVYKAYLSNDIGIWLEALTAKTDRFNSGKKNYDLYELTMAQYGYIAYRIDRKNKSEAERFLPPALSNSEILINNPEYRSKDLALKGALLGFVVTLHPMKGVLYGKTILENIDKAIAADPENPTGYLEKGNAKFHMPAFYGGSVSEAAQNFLKTIELFEKQKSCLKCNWAYLNTLVQLGRCYEAMGKRQSAVAVYKKILAIEPNISWVRDLMEAAQNK